MPAKTVTRMIKEEMKRLLLELEGLDADSDQYKLLLSRLAELQALLPQTKKISGESWLTAAVNLAGIGAVLGYEKANVITSKAFGMIKR